MPLLALLLFAPLAPAQQQPVTLPPNDEQTQLFRGLFHFHKITPEARANIGRGYDYSKLIVVVYGDPGATNVTAICRTALANGGAVLIACDTRLANLNTYFPRGGKLTIHGGTVSHDQREYNDAGRSDRPVVTPRATTNAGLHPFVGISRVATDRPSYLQVEPNGRPTGLGTEFVAEFGPAALVTTRTDLFRAQQFVSLPFALATTDDTVTSRCLVLADPDVFGNRMIYTSGREQSPTDNLKFANNTVQWLKGEGRTKCLFVENGEEATRFDEFEYTAIPTGPQLPPVPPALPDLMDPDVQRKVAEVVNKVADDAQRQDLFNRGLLSGSGGKGVLYTILAVVLAFVLYTVVRWRLVFGWFRRVFRPIPRDPAMLGPDVPVGSLGHRRLELLRSVDYGPVVRSVVRQLFQDRGMPAEYTGDKLPPLDIAVRRPQFLRDSILTLWAEVRSTAPLTFGRWKQLEPLLAAVRAAADDDRWRFADDPTPRDAAP